MDVKPYVFQRNITTVVVPLGEKLQQIKDVYLQVDVKWFLKCISYFFIN